MNNSREGKKIREQTRGFSKRIVKELPDTGSLLLDYLRFRSDFKIEARRIKYEGKLRNVDFAVNLISIFLSVSASIWVGLLALPDLNGRTEFLEKVILYTLPVFLLLIMGRTTLVNKYNAEIEKEYMDIYKVGDKVFDQKIKRAVGDLKLIVLEIKEYMDNEVLKKN